MLSELSKEEKIIIAVIAVAILGVSAWVYFDKNKTKTTANLSTEQVVTTTTETIATSTPTTTPAKVTTTKKPTSPTVAAGEKYADVLKTYSAWRFQFVNCQATPGSFIIKKGGKFMLDNRDAKSHTYKVGTATYRLAAYGWTLATANVLGNLNVTCDGINRAVLKVVP